ncbi:MAG: DUF4287 domain-containing protein [Proteobacteria bacterium]|nr:DUF4287 domain-containing protein [Pseudomonadota bacterium]
MDEALQTMIDNMPEKTGKSLEQWKSVLKKQAFEKHMQAVNYLKQEHSVTHGFANTIVSLSKEENNSGTELLKNQYQNKQNLLPIYQSLTKFVETLGKDVTISPKKTSVSIIRKNQFILIKPATKTRIDLGFKLKDKAFTNRLENSGPFGAMCTHRVRITQSSEVDTELKGWILQAYEQSV